MAATKQSCTRCRTHKRKCDKLRPKCSLCTRSNHSCEYELTTPPNSADVSAAAGDLLSDLPLNDEVFLLSHIKTAITQGLSGNEPGDILSIYRRVIHPWFPIFSDSALRERLPVTWIDAGVEFVFLCFTIFLLSTSPEPSDGDKNSSLSFRTLYLSGKSWLSVLERAGFSSLEMVQSRLLITLFELLHGQYPAAWISVSSTVRAADALAVSAEQDESPYKSKDEGTVEQRQEYMMTWCAILVVDRHIAIENGKWPPITRGRTLPNLSQIIDSSIPKIAQTEIPPISLLFDASALLDKLHIALYEPLSQQSFNVEEMTILVKTLTSFEALVRRENQHESWLYASSLAISSTALLLSFEKGSRRSSSDEEARQCRAPAAVALESLLEDILKTTELFHEGQVASNTRPLTPFVTYLVYKAAAIFTEKLRMGNDSKKSVQSLRSLRNTLRLISQRWHAGVRYLKLLDEDTTPRMLKAINQTGE
ncbi:hypothetical protein BKA64DRAFT_686799 [Cadophora sp. MPI-SDFR-AT-0126]|nr:hypothetical protein BKA64DRAFT_686799 [Leotiomycetes sp. MPI-SDFR-AT-0126]